MSAFSQKRTLGKPTIFSLRVSRQIIDERIRQPEKLVLGTKTAPKGKAPKVANSEGQAYAFLQENHSSDLLVHERGSLCNAYLQ